MNKVPLKAIVTLVSALLYGASPIDLIPDIIPILGLLDDGVVAVLMGLLALHYVRKSRFARQALPVRHETNFDRSR